MVLDFKIIRERIGDIEGFIQIDVDLLNHYSLLIFEYYSINMGVIKYRYQVMDPQKELIVRWDNAPHYPKMASFPHHFHHKDKIFESKQYSIQQILNLIPEHIKYEKE